MAKVTRALLAAYAEEREIDLIFFDPPEVFDPAIMGLVYGFGTEPVVLYDQSKVLAGFMRQGMTDEEAVEWFSVNTIGAFVGPATPRFAFRPAS